MTTFKEQYRETLGNFNHESSKLSESIGLPPNRVQDISDKIDEFFDNLTEEDADVHRSAMYQQLLYTLEPESIMEVFMIAYILRGWEGEHTQIHRDVNKGTAMMKIAIQTSRMKLEEEEKDPKKMFLDFLEVTEQYLDA